MLLYPGLFKNIPHVWFLRLYSLIKNSQYDFPKLRGGVNGRLELFRKFIRFGRVNLPLAAAAALKMLPLKSHSKPSLAAAEMVVAG